MWRRNKPHARRSTIRGRHASSHGTFVSIAIVAGLAAVFASCVDRTVELPAHERLSVEEICEIYCDMQLSCPKVSSFNSACYEICVDPQHKWPEMSEECAHARFLTYACVVDLGCEGLPEAPPPGEPAVQVCTTEEVAPDYDYSPEDCGFSVPGGDGG